MKTLLLLSVLLCAFVSDVAMAQRPIAPIAKTKKHTAGMVFNEVTDFLINRMNVVSLDTQIRDMNTQGLTQKSFVAGFSTEGALLYLKDFSPTEYEKEYTDVGGRKSGLQFIPFELKILSNGSYRYTFNGVAFRNVYEFMSSEKIGNGLSGLSKNIDHMDFVTLTNDSRVSYNNINSIEFTMLNVDVLLPVVKKKILLAADIGSNVGNFGRMEIDGLEKLGYTKDEEGAMNVESKGSLRAGIKFLYKTKDSAKRLEIRSMWENSDSKVTFAKTVPTNGLPVDIETFKLVRTYLHNTIDFSVLNKRSVRPTRIGMALQVDVPLEDKLSTNPDPKYSINMDKREVLDFSKSVNRVNLKIYLKF